MCHKRDCLGWWKVQLPYLLVFVLTASESSRLQLLDQPVQQQLQHQQPGGPCRCSAYQDFQAMRHSPDRKFALISNEHDTVLKGNGKTSTNAFRHFLLTFDERFLGVSSTQKRFCIDKRFWEGFFMSII